MLEGRCGVMTWCNAKLSDLLILELPLSGILWNFWTMIGEDCRITGIFRFGFIISLVLIIIFDSCTPLSYFSLTFIRRRAELSPSIHVPDNIKVHRPEIRMELFGHFFMVRAAVEQPKVVT